MKPVFKCDYCKFMGTKEEVEKHELTCIDNYNRQNCYTCAHRNYKTMNQIECKCGKEIPEGKIWSFVQIMFVENVQILLVIYLVVFLEGFK